jgi:hypothetical protein
MGGVVGGGESGRVASAMKTLIPQNSLVRGAVTALSLSLVSSAFAATVLDVDFSTAGVLASGWTDNSGGAKFGEITGSGIRHLLGPQYISYTLIYGTEATPTLFGGADTITTVTLDYNGFAAPNPGETGVGLVFGTTQIWFNRGDTYQILRVGNDAIPFANGSHTGGNLGLSFGTYNTNNPGQLKIKVTNNGITASADFQIFDNGIQVYSLLNQSVPVSNLGGGVVGIKGFLTNDATAPLYTGLTVDMVSTAIPEPASASALAGAGVVAFALLRRRHRS